MMKFSIPPGYIAPTIWSTLIGSDMFRLHVSTVFKIQSYPLMLTKLCFMFAMLFMVVGIIGEYIGKIYMETKQRPRYIIDTFVWKEEKPDGEESRSNEIQ